MTTIISATNRKDSKTIALAKYYQKQLAEREHEAKLLSLTELPGDLLSNDMKTHQNPGMEGIQELITASKKFIFIIPEYNGSFPGVLKTFIDYCKFPESFYGKKAALVGLSSGKYGNIRGVEHFTGICNYIGLEVLPLKIHISHIPAELNEAHELYKEDTVRFTGQQMDKFIAF